MFLKDLKAITMHCHIEMRLQIANDYILAVMDFLNSVFSNCPNEFSSVLTELYVENKGNPT